MGWFASLVVLGYILAKFVLFDVHAYITEDRIIGGSSVQINDYPYQVSISLGDIHICGGSIIEKNWVLTAAHCFALMNKFSVRSGSSFKSKGGLVQEFNRSDIFIHPQYSNPDYDIALIRVSQSLIEENSVAKSIALPAPLQVFPVGSLGTVSGWGAFTNPWTYPEQLHAVQVPIVDFKLCRERYQNKHSITERMICAGYLQGGKDSCDRDSGGPLVINGVLAGIVSFGEGCAKAKYPGVYTNVASFRNWITEVAHI